MNRDLFDRWCERGILGLVLGILVYSPLAFGATRLQEFLVVQGLTIGVVACWLARVWIAERPTLLFPPLGWAVLAFVGYAAWRYAVCDVEYVGRQELLRVLVYAVLFFAVLNNLHRQESTQIISFTLFGVGTFIAGYAVYQFATGSDLVWTVPSGYAGRGSGTYINPNHLAGLLEMLVPVAMAYVLVGRGKPLTRILLGYAALVMLAGIGATASRGGWVSVGLALLLLCVILFAYKPFRWQALALLVLLCIGGFVTAQKTDYFKKRIDKAFVGGQVDLDTRFVLWETALEMWRDHKWIGVGPGHYDLRFRGYRPASVQLQPERAHNDYLNTLADWGLVGAVIVGAGVLLLFAAVPKIWKNVQRGERAFASSTSDKFAYVLGTTLGLVALAAHSVLDFNLQIPANAIVAFTLAALLASHWRFATERFWFTIRWPGKATVTVLLLSGGIYLGYQEVRLGREWLCLRHAAQAELDSLEQAERLELAYQIEPRNGDTAHAIGEIYRVNAAEGRGEFAEQAAQAITWYQRGITNNPHDGNNYMRWGMVLDFLNRHSEAEKLFLKANELDPNGYFTTAHVGRHYVDSGEYAAARPWLERSLRLWRKDNEIAAQYLTIANTRLLEAAEDPLLRRLREEMRALNSP